MFATNTLDKLKSRLTSGDSKAAMELISRLRNGLKHAFEVPQRKT